MKKISSRTRACAAALAMVSALTLVACGSEKSADPPATSAAAADTVPVTILPPATTAAESSTTAPTTTPETTPSTTAPTTPPVDEETEAKQAVIEAAEHAWYVFNEAKLDPTNDEKVHAAVAAHAGNAKARIEEVIRDYRASNYKSVASDVAPANVAIDAGSVQLNVAAGTATVELCELNSNAKVAATDDGSPGRVIDDGISAYRSRDSLQLLDGRWVVNDAVDLERYEGALTCDAVG